MKISKCNGCGKVLDKKQEVVYSICDITKHVPGSMTSRLVFSHSEGSLSTQKVEESWIEYVDIDMCETCWNGESFKKYISEE